MNGPPSQQRSRGGTLASAATGGTASGSRGGASPLCTGTASDASALAHAVELARAARAADGWRCPRCGCSRVIGWGGFAGRSRYRCYGCKRTFSDFTATPLAYTKHAGLWARYCDCLLKSSSVRRAAAVVGVTAPTAFRWRHAILAGLRRAPSAALTGRVELVHARYRYSNKGARGRGLDSGRPRRWTYEPGQRQVLVLFGRDEAHATLAEVVGERLLSAVALKKVLVACVARGSSIVAEAGRFSPYAVACNGAGLRFRPDAAGRPGGGDARTACRAARELRARFEAWVERFRGVATRYLPNYLRWSRHLGAGGEPTDQDPRDLLLLACCRVAAGGV